MTAKIVAISGFAVACEVPEPQNDIIEVLEQALAQARNGEIVDVAVVKVNAPSQGAVSVSTRWSTPPRDCFAIQSGAALLAKRILDDIDEA